MKPLAVSMGDPAGIGLELAARVWAEREGAPPFFLVGDPDAFARASARIGAPKPSLNVVTEAADAAAQDGALDVLHVPLAMEETPGAPNPVNAQAKIEAIKQGVDAVRSGGASALVTLPIAKAVLHTADFGFPGHTEFIAHLTEKDEWAEERGPVMLLAGATLKVALATIHTPLAQAPKALTRERIVKVGRVLGQALRRDFGVDAPRIALCGLNPHAGEDGHIGREEIETINPAAAQLRSEGWTVSDARSADALFHEDARRGYDGVIALYHDQGLIPIKTLHFWDAVNVTLGLPIVRTSPDHGTGFDIAGKGVARADSFRAALKLAWEMAERRSRA
ncbi:MAG TPA: 4-hydroxythreonine-4-phosphate dehydrogenase PdxA [Vitreimonas sp.]|uniref:4-hydroxythreonine-4-phosphate dehydrogenase PdxA n=1 Tax=Vitreimonas sp. TaxID=3069702 RepID=UPI002D443A68|nr:4-hydroxythreonine-4-phosphate dehydrogenase PdxA [Vitreimonas sp.]HYD89505.1 4-hydroxythreonine-4-phosphate dehydrogenase PdxA [Vitreimonas sp.]